MLKQTAVLAMTVAVMSNALAAEETNSLGLSLSGTAALTTDYRFRGLSQTQNDPAVQATFTVSHDSGVYLGVFGSNVHFGDDSPHLELSPYLGYSTELNFSDTLKPVLDISYTRFNYPGWSDWAWNEFSVKLSFADVIINHDSLLTSINYGDDYAGFAGDEWNFSLGYVVPIADTGFGLVTGLGYTSIDQTGALADASADDYIDWKVGISYDLKSLAGLTAELAAVGTNIDTDGLARVTKRGVDTGAVFTLSKSF
ncbi:TorF family putative porin [Acinetobacter puyangensis]|uniref:Outer membrane protein n=1 Tax=Acinetobacter puyangensis TaxID=1096779 RepID=A0A240EB51_9GAMM|nr:TorF family putative porin [Acinetobacter puyangensis]SNX45892.1 conserved hypothetical protein [Acinetobacter puyangensis]